MNLTNCSYVDMINSVNIDISELPNASKCPRIYPFYKDGNIISIEILALDVELSNYLHNIDSVPYGIINKISTIEKCQLVYGRKIAQRINKLFNENGVLGVLSIIQGTCPSS